MQGNVFRFFLDLYYRFLAREEKMGYHKNSYSLQTSDGRGKGGIGYVRSS